MQHMTGRSVVFFSLGFLKYLLADFVQRRDFLKERQQEPLDARTPHVMQQMRLRGCATEQPAHLFEITGSLSVRDAQRTESSVTSDPVCAHQVEQVSFDPLLPAPVGLLPLLNAHQLVSVPGHQRLAPTHTHTHCLTSGLRPPGPEPSRLSRTMTFRLSRAFVCSSNSTPIVKSTS